MGNLLKNFRKHRARQQEEKEIVERRLEKYTTKPLSKKKVDFKPLGYPLDYNEKEKSEKDGNNV